MSAIHQNATIGDTVYFWFAANDWSTGEGDDGANPAADVREAGATASDAPLISPTPALLSNAAYPAGCYEIAVEATTGNGFVADMTFAVFSTILVDSQNPTGFVGSCTLTPLATSEQVGNLTSGTAAINTTASTFVKSAAEPETNVIMEGATAGISPPRDGIGLALSVGGTW